MYINFTLEEAWRYTNAVLMPLGIFVDLWLDKQSEERFDVIRFVCWDFHLDQMDYKHSYFLLYLTAHFS